MVKHWRTQVTYAVSLAACAMGLAACTLGGPSGFRAAAAESGFRAAAAEPETCDSTGEILRDKQPYSAGSYLSFLAPWNKGDFQEGREYSECLSYHRETYPDGQKISWRWPDAPPKSKGVYNFLAVDYGDYFGTKVKAPIQPKSVNAIKVLSQNYYLAIHGNVEGFDVLDDFFLTAAPGSFDKRLFEVEILLHSPPYSIGYAKSVKQVGTIKASGVEWSVSIDQRTNPPDILILPVNRADLLSGDLDIKVILDQLVQAGVLTGAEYFNGLGLGVEVRQGSGSLEIKHLSTSYN